MNCARLRRITQAGLVARLVLVAMGGVAYADDPPLFPPSTPSEATPVVRLTDKACRLQVDAKGVISVTPTRTDAPPRVLDSAGRLHAYLSQWRKQTRKPPVLLLLAPEAPARHVAMLCGALAFEQFAGVSVRYRGQREGQAILLSLLSLEKQFTIGLQRQAVQTRHVTAPSNSSAKLERSDAPIRIRLDRKATAGHLASLLRAAAQTSRPVVFAPPEKGSLLTVTFTPKGEAVPLTIVQKPAGEGPTTVDLPAVDAAFIGYRGPELMPDEIYEGHEATNFLPSHTYAGRGLFRGKVAPGKGNEWMAVRRWYVVGPFPRRALKDEKSPTMIEAKLDPWLSKAFQGDGGKRIAWQWENACLQRRTVKIELPSPVSYGRWYATTEVYCDSDRQVWTAVGIDDFGKLWVNGEHVWSSPGRPRPFNATENIQPIKLRKGYNRFLMRVDNAGGTAGFSLLFKLPVE